MGLAYLPISLGVVGFSHSNVGPLFQFQTGLVVPDPVVPSQVLYGWTLLAPSHNSVSFLTVPEVRYDWISRGCGLQRRYPRWSSRAPIWLEAEAPNSPGVRSRKLFFQETDCEKSGN